MKQLKFTLALIAGLAFAGAAFTALADDAKTVNYYLTKNETSDAMHEDVCHGDTEKVTATGTLTETDGKEMLTVTKLEKAK